MHLEQGPVLEVGGDPLGVVSAIAGQTRLSVSLLGTQVSFRSLPYFILLPVEAQTACVAPSIDSGSN